MRKLTRSYQLKIYPNFHKLEDIRYSTSRYKLYLQHFITQLYYSNKRFFSTKDMGTLPNQAQKQAIGIIKQERESIKITNNKSSCPQIKFDMCPARINISKKSSFDYWIILTSHFKNRGIKIPAKSHRKLNEKLRSGWKLSKYCELVKVNNTWYVKVFVTKPYVKAQPKVNFIGIDVGIKHASTRSDGYLGKNLLPIIKKEKQKQADRQRNKHPKKPFKSKIKQLLDVEVQRAIRRSKANAGNLVIEHPKSLANLKMRKLGRWAQTYFASRLQQRADEEGIYVQWVNPAYTSITCSKCKTIDKQSRVNQALFKCSTCKKELHADINAARNIARKGQESFKNR
jgi:IS605 OrfB family transposase